jgi:hypothetical protein
LGDGLGVERWVGRKGLMCLRPVLPALWDFWVLVIWTDLLLILAEQALTDCGLGGIISTSCLRDA